MRINHNNPLDPFFSADAVKSRASKADPSKAGAGEAGSVGAGQVQALVGQALAAPDFRAQAVADAKHLVETGQLESESSIHRLAERLTDLGV